MTNELGPKFATLMENFSLSHAVRYGKVEGVVITRESDETERNYTV